MFQVASISTRLWAVTQQTVELNVQVTELASFPVDPLAVTVPAVTSQEPLTSFLERLQSNHISWENLDAGLLQVEAVIRGLVVAIDALDIKYHVKDALNQSQQAVFAEFEAAQTQVEEVRPYLQRFPRLQAALDKLSVTREERDSLIGLLEGINMCDVVYNGRKEQKTPEQLRTEWAFEFMNNRLPSLIDVFTAAGVSRRDVFHLLRRLVKYVHDPMRAADGLIKAIPLMQEDGWTGAEIVQLCIPLFKSSEWSRFKTSVGMLQFLDIFFLESRNHQIAAEKTLLRDSLTRLTPSLSWLEEVDDEDKGIVKDVYAKLFQYFHQTNNLPVFGSSRKAIRQRMELVISAIRIIVDSNSVPEQEYWNDYVRQFIIAFEGPFVNSADFAWALEVAAKKIKAQIEQDYAVVA